MREAEIPEAERVKATAQSRAHWLLALDELEAPGRRPCLVMVGGLPGTGKSTLARGLAREVNLQLIRSDVVRKELAGLPLRTSARAPFAEGIYSKAWSDKTYAECLHRTEELLLDGQRVCVDASFGQEDRRREFSELASRLCVPAVFIVCQSSAQSVRQRLYDRRGDVSDADWSVYQQAAEGWEEAKPNSRQVVRIVSTEGTPEQTLPRGIEMLRDRAILE